MYAQQLTINPAIERIEPVIRFWADEADKYLQGKYLAILTESGINNPNSVLKYRTKLEEEESQYFILGLENGIFTIDNEGYAQSKALPKPSKNSDKQKMFQMFWHSKDGRFLFREGVCQLSTISRLILKDGWNMSQILMEPTLGEFGNLAYGVDILLKSIEDEIIVCGEVKGDRASFTSLIKGFKYCCEQGSHDKKECKYASNHPKYSFCESVKPQYFWAVSPCQEICFKLDYLPNGRILLEELESIPDKGDILTV